MKLLIIPQSLSFVPNGVWMVWAGFLQEPLEVVRGWPRLMFVAVCGSQATPHVRAARLPVIVVIVADHSRGPLKVLLVLLFAALDTLHAVVGGDIRRRSISTAQDHLLFLWVG
jgi:hypothetical protein